LQQSALSAAAALHNAMPAQPRAGAGILNSTGVGVTWPARRPARQSLKLAIDATDEKRRVTFIQRPCYAMTAVAFFIATMSTLLVMAQEHPDDLGRLADDLGQISAWRNIPGVLLERCAEIAPQNKDEMQQSWNAWNKNNADLVALIDDLVEASTPLFARSISSNLEDARMAMRQESKRLIIENYFEGKRFTPLEICAEYKNIVGKLSLPGEVAFTRGTAYTLEMNLSLRKK
jgi:hypothetical protein